MISAQRLNSLLHYDAAAGIFCWKWRADRNAAWNGKMPGRIAGTSSRGYIGIRIDGQRYLAHRLAWVMTYGPIPPGLQIDHVDMNPSNNRINNLRLATQSQNNANSIRKSTSGIKGVTWRQDRGRWVASITIKKRSVRIGYFDTAEDAHVAYLERARAEYGDFARGDL